MIGVKVAAEPVMPFRFVSQNPGGIVVIPVDCFSVAKILNVCRWIRYVCVHHGYMRAASKPSCKKSKILMTCVYLEALTCSCVEM